jgi:hypothetical protein
LSEAYNVRFEPLEDGQQMHGAVTHVIDRGGRFAAKFHGLRFDPLNMVLYIRPHQQRPETGKTRARLVGQAQGNVPMNIDPLKRHFRRCRGSRQHIHGEALQRMNDRGSSSEASRGSEPKWSVLAYNIIRSINLRSAQPA